MSASKDVQNIREHILDKVAIGQMTVHEANVQLVRMERYRLIHNRLPMAVRRDLQAAVKAGILAHLKKDGHKPEAFFHPVFKCLAIEAREAHERSIKRAARACLSYSQEERSRCLDPR